MSFISDLFGGSQQTGNAVTTTDNSPWAPQQQHLRNIFSGAQNAFNNAPPQYYPNATYVDPSAQTNQAMDMMQQRALAGSPLQQAGMNTMQQAASGQMMNSNPYLQENITRAQQPMIDQFNSRIAPGIDSSFAGAGRLGSGLYAQSRNRAEDTLTRGLGNMAGQMGSDAYNKERQYMMQAAQLAPTMAQSDYNDMSQLANVGGMREGFAGQQLQDSMNRFNFSQQAPWDQLGRYSGLVTGNYGGTETQAVPQYSNPMGNLIGGAYAGSQIGNTFGQPGLGAAAGGLLGMFS